MYTKLRRRRYAGITMIELIMFIVVVGIGVAGILSVLSGAVRGSADPMRRKQAIAIAESVLTEIEQQQFTYCDPADAAFSSAAGTGGCAISQDGAGGGSGTVVAGAPFPAGPRSSFNNVADYSGWNQTPVTDIVSGNSMAGYSVTVTITRAGGAAPFATVAAGAALKIDVSVAFGTESPIVITGYRFRFAPHG